MMNNLNSILSKFKQKAVKEKFTKIYSENAFLGRESKSGEGSGLAQTSVSGRSYPFF